VLCVVFPRLFSCDGDCARGREAAPTLFAQGDVKLEGNRASTLRTGTRARRSSRRERESLSWLFAVGDRRSWRRARRRCRHAQSWSDRAGEVVLLARAESMCPRGPSASCVTDRSIQRRLKSQNSIPAHCPTWRSHPSPSFFSFFGLLIARAQRRAADRIPRAASKSLAKLSSLFNASGRLRWLGRRRGSHI